MNDTFGLQRFVDAQVAGGTYTSVLAELRDGRKQGHWIWYVFPQLAGLGTSPTSQYYGITGLAEARAYLAHPVLGPRLLECTRVLTELPGSDPVAVLGPIDAQKLRSSMTLFALADPDEPLFPAVLSRYFAGHLDQATVSRIGSAAPR